MSSIHRSRQVIPVTRGHLGAGTRSARFFSATLRLMAAGRPPHSPDYPLIALKDRARDAGDIFGTPSSSSAGPEAYYPSLRVSRSSLLRLSGPQLLWAPSQEIQPHTGSASRSGNGFLKAAY